ncbi:MAG: tetratricopeptide repeat protein [Muribaculaceae bacterium]|nr:tetratricopeptide repeat protein [Muribaculaceae bacterium]
MRRISTYILAFIILTIAGCTHQPVDSRLLQLYTDKVDDYPEEVLATLDTLNTKQFSEADRQFFNLLQLKARDKAYIVHTSDSMILTLVDYYRNHKSAELYPEALYYAGRVYSDLGDYPTSLKYFHKALDELPENTSNLKLKTVILSQTGRLLEHLRLYDEAIQCLEKEMQITIKESDSLKHVYDYQLLGAVYLNMGSYDKATECFHQALNYSKNLPPHHTAKSKVYLASIEYQKDSIETALHLIRGLPDSVNPITRNYALAVAADIYRSVGYNDTAYFYAKELIRSEDSNNKKTGYRIALSPESARLISLDTLYTYLQEYKEILEQYFDDNEREKALIQQSIYNYDFHKRDKEKVAYENIKLKSRLTLATTIIFLLIALILLIFLFKTRRKLKLWRGIDKVRKLKQRADTETTHKEEPLEPELTSSQLRERLRKELEELVATKPSIPAFQLIKSDIFHRIESLLKEKKPIPEGSDIWEQMEAEIVKASPNFKENLIVLTDGKLKQTDYTLALLMRFGFSSTQMSILLSRAVNTISTRKDSLCKKIFDEKRHSKEFEAIILYL